MKKINIFYKSIFNNKRDMLSLFLTYFCLFSFAFVFFELSANQYLKNDIFLLKKPLFSPINMFFSTLDIIAFVVMILCSLVLFELYNEFIKKNVRENSIFRICGFSIIDLSFLYVSVFIIISIFSIPIGLFLGYGFTIIIHYLLFNFLNINESIFLIDKIIFVGLISLVLLLIICVAMYTAGYFYKNQLINILNGNINNEYDTNVLYKKITIQSSKNKNLLIIAGFFILVFELFQSNSPTLGTTLICIGLYKNDKSIVQYIHKKKIKNSATRIVSIGNAKMFIQKNINYIYVLQLSIIFLSFIVTYDCYLKSDQLVGILAYVLTFIFMCMCLAYKILLNIFLKKNIYVFCNLLGFSFKKILLIVKKEINYILLKVLLIPMMYQFFLLVFMIKINVEISIIIISIIFVSILIISIVRKFLYLIVKNFIKKL